MLQRGETTKISIDALAKGHSIRAGLPRGRVNHAKGLSESDKLLAQTARSPRGLAK